ncbi:hypothetical protein RRG08_050056 [Elysia crispata]|uniref:Uncharacterized protein n=1 Tax=Elysia crispata TaxID=231223 RepID=A0AAE1ED04_9GAST|nr:hypothetical protein RRG08_050056 [Elysia crispata]
MLLPFCIVQKADMLKAQFLLETVAAPPYSIALSCLWLRRLTNHHFITLVFIRVSDTAETSVGAHTPEADFRYLINELPPETLELHSGSFSFTRAFFFKNVAAHYLALRPPSGGVCATRLRIICAPADGKLMRTAEMITPSGHLTSK